MQENCGYCAEPVPRVSVAAAVPPFPRFTGRAHLGERHRALDAVVSHFGQRVLGERIGVPERDVVLVRRRLRTATGRAAVGRGGTEGTR